MKYLKLFESFNPIDILTAPKEEVLSKQSFDYLCACLNYVARACAGESKHLKSREPIDELVGAIVRYGDLINIKVDRFGKQTTYLDFQDCLEGSYNYLKAIDKFVDFTHDEDVYYEPSDLEKPTGELKNILENGFYLIERIYNEFRLLWSGKLGEAPPADEIKGNFISHNIPRRK